MVIYNYALIRPTKVGLQVLLCCVVVWPSINTDAGGSGEDILLAGWSPLIWPNTWGLGLSIAITGPLLLGSYSNNYQYFRDSLEL